MSLAHGSTSMLSVRTTTKRKRTGTTWPPKGRELTKLYRYVLKEVVIPRVGMREEMVFEDPNSDTTLKVLTDQPPRRQHVIELIFTRSLHDQVDGTPSIEKEHYEL